MKSLVVPMIGDKFGKLTVTGDFVSKNGRYWPCLCECGGTALVSITSLKRRKETNGGCSNCYRTKHGHGSSRNPTYSKYQAMKQRCGNPNHKDYPNYGGRGIEICERWLNSFDNFLTDMGESPKGHSIDRIDVNGNYEPSNCRWATKQTQARNTRSNRKVTIDGRTFNTLAEACEAYKIDYRVVIGRLSRGNSVETSIKSPLVVGFKGKGLSESAALEVA